MLAQPWFRELEFLAQRSKALTKENFIDRAFKISNFSILVSHSVFLALLKESTHVKYFTLPSLGPQRLDAPVRSRLCCRLFPIPPRRAPTSRPTGKMLGLEEAPGHESLFDFLCPAHYLDRLTFSDCRMLKLMSQH